MVFSGIVRILIVVVASLFAILFASGVACGAWSLLIGKIRPWSRRGVNVAIATGLCFALMNVSAECGLSVAVGGEAFRGEIVDNHYFVCSHGHHTEVSERLWRFKRWQEQLTLISLPLLVPALLWVAWDRLATWLRPKHDQGEP
jgi:hypothetical protein